MACSRRTPDAGRGVGMSLRWVGGNNTNLTSLWFEPDSRSKHHRLLGNLYNFGPAEVDAHTPAAYVWEAHYGTGAWLPYRHLPLNLTLEEAQELVFSWVQIEGHPLIYH